MLINAIEQISQFTRPIHTIMKAYSSAPIAGMSTIFFVNDSGVAITCRHVGELILQADLVNNQYNSFKVEREMIPNDKKYRATLQGLEARYKIKKETTVLIKHNFINVGNFSGITVHLHPTLDLAILVFNDLTDKKYSSHATFINDPNQIKPGKYLCRYGYPFPEFTNFRHNEETDDLEWTNEGKIGSPAFPIDGIITRLAGVEENISEIELSTPGLKGQSGGPLFDQNGLVYGMQFVTHTLYLGFDVKNMEIIKDGKKERVSDSAFLHIGRCIHVDRIKDFLKEKNVTFYE